MAKRSSPKKLSASSLLHALRLDQVGLSTSMRTLNTHTRELGPLSRKFSSDLTFRELTGHVPKRLLTSLSVTRILTCQEEMVLAEDREDVRTSMQWSMPYKGARVYVTSRENTPSSGSTITEALPVCVLCRSNRGISNLVCSYCMELQERESQD